MKAEGNRREEKGEKENRRGEKNLKRKSRAVSATLVDPGSVLLIN